MPYEKTLVTEEKMTKSNNSNDKLLLSCHTYEQLQKKKNFLESKKSSENILLDFSYYSDFSFDKFGKKENNERNKLKTVITTLKELHNNQKLQNVKSIRFSIHTVADLYSLLGFDDTDIDVGKKFKNLCLKYTKPYENLNDDQKLATYIKEALLFNDNNTCGEKFAAMLRIKTLGFRKQQLRDELTSAQKEVLTDSNGYDDFYENLKLPDIFDGIDIHVSFSCDFLLNGMLDTLPKYLTNLRKNSQNFYATLILEKFYKGRPPKKEEICSETIEELVFKDDKYKNIFKCFLDDNDNFIVPKNTRLIVQNLTLSVSISGNFIVEEGAEIYYGNTDARRRRYLPLVPVQLSSSNSTEKTPIIPPAIKLDMNTCKKLILKENAFISDIQTSQRGGYDFDKFDFHDKAKIESYLAEIIRIGQNTTNEPPFLYHCIDLTKETHKKRNELTAKELKNLGKDDKNFFIPTYFEKRHHDQVIANGTEKDIKEFFKNPKNDLTHFYQGLAHIRKTGDSAKRRKFKNNKTVHDVIFEAINELCEEEESTTINNKIQNAFLMGLHSKNKENNCALYNALGIEEHGRTPINTLGDPNLVNLILEFEGKRLDSDKVVVTLPESKKPLKPEAPLKPKGKKKIKYKEGWASTVVSKKVSFEDLLSVRESILQRGLRKKDAASEVNNNNNDNNKENVDSKLQDCKVDNKEKIQAKGTQ